MNGISIALGLVLLSFVYLAISGRMRLPHLLMALGGLILLGQGVRFFQEWACLSAALVAHMAAAPTGARRSAPQVYRGVAAFLSIVLLVAPVHLFLTKRSDHNGYPLEAEGLPLGVAAFLDHVDAQGNLFAPPGVAGYLEWSLHPDVRVFTDMRMNQRIYDALMPLRNDHAFKRLVDSYEIDYLSVALSTPGINDLIAMFDEFVPVFYDDVHVVYANRKFVPQIADKYELKWIDPYNLVAGKGSLEERISELRRIDGIHPAGRRTLHALILLLFGQERFEEAEPYARRFVQLYPSNPNSTYLLGDIYENTDRCDMAVDYYEKARAYSDERFKKVLDKHIGTCHYLSQDFIRAYEAFDRSVNPYVRQEEPEDLYQYAYSAIVAGDLVRAERTLRQLLYVVDPAKHKLIADSQALLGKLEGGELSAVGFFDWLKYLLTDSSGRQTDSG